MMQCFIDPMLLTAQRSTEIRNLRWTADPRDPDGCRPRRRRDPLPAVEDRGLERRVGRLQDHPEIDAVLERARGIGRVKGVHVIHTKQGKPYAANTVLKAWKVAKQAGLEDVRYTIMTSARWCSRMRRTRATTSRR